MSFQRFALWDTVGEVDWSGAFFSKSVRYPGIFGLLHNLLLFAY